MSQYKFTKKIKAGEQNQDFLPWVLRGANYPGSLKQDWKKNNLLLGITHAMTALLWTLTIHLVSLRTARRFPLWSVMSCAGLPPSGFAPWLLHCPVQEQMDWSFPRSHPWCLWLGDNWLQAGHVRKQRPQTSKIFLTSYRGIQKTFSTGFTANPPTLRSNHILMTHPIMLSCC